jgi:hypothetical protein
MRRCKYASILCSISLGFNAYLMADSNWGVGLAVAGVPIIALAFAPEIDDDDSV